MQTLRNEEETIQEEKKDFGAKIAWETLSVIGLLSTEYFIKTFGNVHVTREISNKPYKISHGDSLARNFLSYACDKITEAALSHCNTIEPFRPGSSRNLHLYKIIYR